MADHGWIAAHDPLSITHHIHSEPDVTVMGPYDYIIVGAGSAGCVLADRLSADGRHSVLLLEAGGWDRDPWISIPLGWGRIFTNRLHDWMYFSEPQDNLGNRAVECARGKVIGGSSSINAMAYVRGHRSDFDRWSEAGLPDWSYAHVLPYFKRQESWEGGAGRYRGSSGPLSTITSRYADPIVAAYFEAASSAGHPETPDYNGACQEGFGPIQMTIRDGRRCSAAVAYLHPARGRSNLTVVAKTLVTRVLMEGQRAVGIEYMSTSGLHQIRAEREVILSAGVINTPQLLMLSGIGDPDELTRHDIPVKAALPGVGRNLQDHWTVAVEYARAQPGPFQANMRLDRIAVHLADAYIRGHGFATDLPSGWTAFLKTDSSLQAPDIQLLFRGTPPSAGPYLPPFSRPFGDGFACRATLLRPKSRGAVRLSSADPSSAPRIFQNGLVVDDDWRKMRDALRLVRDLGRQPSLKPFIAREIAPDPKADTDAALDEHIRSFGATAHHPLGTCKMGSDSDAEAVVDSRLRVRGVEALRVVDASVFPDAIGGNINAAVIMIAEKASDIVLGHAPLPADDAASLACQ
jgi:4-pyridoxate dehydrogenase